MVLVLYFWFVGMPRFELGTPRPPDEYSNRTELHPEKTPGFLAGTKLTICHHTAKFSVELIWYGYCQLIDIQFEYND